MARKDVINTDGSLNYDRIGQFQEDIETLTAQSADNAIKPESFFGTDYQKLQQAFDAALSQKRPLQISKIYDIGNNTIMLNKPTYTNYPLFVYGGGTIKKSSDGYIFSPGTIDVSGIIFGNIFFVGDPNKQVKMFDNGNGRLFRINTFNCFILDIHTVFHTTDYVQTIRMFQDTCVGIVNAVFDVGGAYDVLCDGVDMEASPGVFFIDRKTGSNPSLFNVRLINGAIEGSSSVNPVISIKGCDALTIQGIYFESNNGGNISFASDAILRNAVVEKCSLMGATAKPLISWGGDCYNVKGSNNYASTGIINDFTNVKSDRRNRVIIENNIYPGGTNKDTNPNPNVVYYRDINNDLEVKKQANNVITPDLFKELLVAIASGSMTSYKDNYLSLYNNGLIMGGLSLAVRGSDFLNSPPTANLVDKSGMNKTGVANGFLYTTASGSDGAGAITFGTAQDNYLSFPNTDYDEMTIEYVFTVLTLPSVNSGLLGCASFNTSGYGLEIFTDNKLSFVLENATQFILTGTTTLSINTKYVAQIRYSTIRRKVTIHLNGVQEASMNNTVSYKTKSNNPLYVGKDLQFPNRVNHKMHTLNIYNRCLTDEELLVNYNVLKL